MTKKEASEIQTILENIKKNIQLYKIRHNYKRWQFGKIVMWHLKYKKALQDFVNSHQEEISYKTYKHLFDTVVYGKGITDYNK